MKHSPLIRLQAAKTAYYWAQQNCPHWDYESDDLHSPCGRGECCQELFNASCELTLARLAVEKEAKQ